MFKYTVKRALFGALTLFILATITFFLMKSIPGNPFNGDKKLSAQQLAQLNEKYHLDKPVGEQYVLYLKGLLQGDLGVSIARKKNVGDIIFKCAPVTMRLGLVAFCIAVVVGITLGTISALSKKKWVSYFITFFTTLGVSVPSFLLALLLLMLFGVWLRWLPIVGLQTPKHYIMPATAIALYPISMIAKLTRSSMSEVMKQDYMVLAKSKGSSSISVIVKHGLRNALLPVVTYAGPMLAFLFSGSFVVETLFSVPGIGSEFVKSINARDYSMIMGCTIFLGFLIITLNIVTDLVSALVDPRIKLGK